APAELDVSGREEQRVAAELVQPDFEADARARRALLEDHREGLAPQRLVAVVARLHPLCERKDVVELVALEVGDRQEVSRHRGVWFAFVVMLRSLLYHGDRRDHRERIGNGSSMLLIAWAVGLCPSVRTASRSPQVFSVLSVYSVVKTTGYTASGPRPRRST